MPCVNGREDGDHQEHEILTRLLSEVCRFLQDANLWALSTRDITGLRTWWQAHQEHPEPLTKPER